MINYLEDALTGEETDEAETPWDGTSGETVRLFPQKRRKAQGTDGGGAAEAAALRRSDTDETGQAAPGEKIDMVSTPESRTEAEEVSMAAVSRRVFKASEPEWTARLFSARREREDQQKSEARQGERSTAGADETMLRSAERFDRLVEREARRYDGPFSLF